MRLSTSDRIKLSYEETAQNVKRFSEEVNTLHGRIDSFCNDVQLRDAPLSSLMYSKMLLRRTVNMLDKAEKSARTGE
jgi:hypothetical protein